MKTTSYEISKKLKEAGFEAEADYYFYGQQLRNSAFPRHIADADNKGNVKSYDLETLLDALPNTTEIIISSLTGERIFYLDSNIRGNEVSIAIEENESLADTAGKMWLLLKDKGIIC